MNREEFDHAIRAAGSILDVEEILVIGSQAVHGSIGGHLPEAALRSVEVDVAALDDNDGSQADLIDGSIGEASMFHESFGFYVQGVVAETAVLPAGWRERLVRYQSPATGGVVAWCLELHDLWISKAIAGRPKDREFCRALLDAEYVDRATLTTRLAAVAGLDPAVVSSVEDMTRA
jgi:hypothetical protein